MGNLSVQSNQAVLPLQTQAPAVAVPAQKTTAPTVEKSALGQDALEWKNIPASERVKTAITTTFKQTIIPYTVGGALAAPAAGAVLGGFIGLFSGNAGKFAVEGMKVGARFMPHGAAAGAVVSGVDAAVTGTVVGSAPDKKSAMLRMGTLSAVAGILTADNKWDLVGAGVGTAAESVRAARIFDKTQEALQAK